MARKKAKKKGTPLTQVERNQRWREKNRDHYNSYMQKYRARKKKENES